MLGLSPVRLLIIVVVALVVLGPDKLPQYARQAGTAWKSLKGIQQRVEDELREVVPDLPRTSDLARYARSPVSLLNQLADRVTAEERAAKGEDEPVDPSADSGEGFEPPNDPPEVRDPERRPLAWGDPSLN
ncbi:MAG TPA: twin-arginine translocase TatA/TatE family subunit [Acidimicrobiales bacterium]|jgi:sec-independent protein translocase protein TatB|nr:twin-arginine translocase TatA/TatE family subunit [Acidimicrobiales bacterium]